MPDPRLFGIDEDDELAPTKKLLVYALLVFALGVGAYFAFRFLYWLLGFIGGIATRA